MFNKYSFILLFSNILSLLLFQPLSAETSSTEFYEDAVVRINEGDYKGAIIQLKNVLKADPKMNPAHLLMGKTYLLDGDPASAESALMQADLAGASKELTQPLLAKAYLQQSKYKMLLISIANKGFNDNKIKANVLSELMVYRGQAYIELQNYVEAELAYDQALFLKEDNVDAMAGKAIIAIRTRKTNNIQALIDKGMTLEPNNSQMWSVLASISHLQGKLAEAEQQYLKVIQFDDKQVDAKIALAGIYLDTKKFNKAQALIDKLLLDFSYNPKIAYLASVLANLKGNQKKANEHTQKAAEVLDALGTDQITGNQSLTMLAGMVYYDLARYQQAADYLKTYISLYPEQLGIYKLYASNLYQLKKYQEIINLFQPVISRINNNPTITTLLGKAYLNRNDYNKAVKYLELSKKLDANPTQYASELAQAYLQQGKKDKAFVLLNNLYTKKPSDLFSGLTLAKLLYQRNQISEALSIGQSLEILYPDYLPLTEFLAILYASQSQFDQAKIRFEKVLQKQPDKLLIQIHLARIAREQKQFDLAKQIYLKLLKEKKDFLPAYNDLADIAILENKTNDAILYLDKAQLLVKNDWRIPLKLSKLYLQTGQTDKARETILNAYNNVYDSFGNIDNFDNILKVANVLIKLADIGTINSMLERLKLLALTNSEKLKDIALLEIQAGRTNEALTTIQRASDYQPENVQIKLLLARLLLKSKKIEESQQEVEKLKLLTKDLTIISPIQADIAMQQQQYSQAANLYQQAFNQKTSNKLLLQLSRAYLLSGETQHSQDILQDWLKLNPNDQLVRLNLARLKVQFNQYQKAQLYFEELTKALPENDNILNQLALIYLHNNHSDALITARKAYQINPKSPTNNDTLGWILVKQKQNQEGLKYLRQAQFRLGNNPKINYHIALSLYQQGRIEEAKQLLQNSLAKNVNFKEKAEAEKLLKEINR